MHNYYACCKEILFPTWPGLDSIHQFPNWKALEYATQRYNNLLSWKQIMNWKRQPVSASHENGINIWIDLFNSVREYHYFFYYYHFFFFHLTWSISWNLLGISFQCHQFIIHDSTRWYFGEIQIDTNSFVNFKLPMFWCQLSGLGIYLR